MASVQLQGQPWAAFRNALAGSTTNTAFPFINTARKDPELKKARARLGCAQGTSFPGAELARSKEQGLTIRGQLFTSEALKSYFNLPFLVFK